MGQRQVKISPEELEELTILSSFTREELYRLNIAFQDLDTENRGYITVAQFIRLPQIEFNPFLRRLVDVFGFRQSINISFRQFVTALSVLSENAPKDAKLRFAFRLYDIDGDNMVGKEDLESMLQLVIGEQLGEERIKTIAQRALDELDVDGDSKLSFSEFGKAAVHSEMFQKLSVPF